MNICCWLVSSKSVFLQERVFCFFSLKLLGLQQNPLMRKVVVDLPDRISWEMQKVEMLLHLLEIALGAHNIEIEE